MGCAFCESGRLKKVRNLETYEMVEQILLVEDDIKLIKIAKKYVTREQMHKKGYRTVDDGSNRLFIDEITNRKGGYGFNESFDDQGLDEREEGLHL